MSVGSEDYRWKSVIDKMEKMESRIDQENRTTNLYDPHYCYSENDDNAHIIGGYVQNTFKFKCKSIIKRIDQSDVHIQSRKTKKKTFYPLQKDFLPKGKPMTIKKNYTLFTMKHMDLCDHDPSCILSCGFMCDDVIRNYIKRKESSRHMESSKKPKPPYDFVYSQMEQAKQYIYSGTLLDFEWKKGCYE